MNIPDHLFQRLGPWRTFTLAAVHRLVQSSPRQSYDASDLAKSDLGPLVSIGRISSMLDRCTTAGLKPLQDAVTILPSGIEVDRQAFLEVCVPLFDPPAAPSFQPRLVGGQWEAGSHREATDWLSDRLQDLRYYAQLRSDAVRPVASLLIRECEYRSRLKPKVVYDLGSFRTWIRRRSELTLHRARDNSPIGLGDCWRAGVLESEGGRIPRLRIPFALAELDGATGLASELCTVVAPLRSYSRYWADLAYRVGRAAVPMVEAVRGRLLRADVIWLLGGKEPKADLGGMLYRLFVRHAEWRHDGIVDPAALQVVADELLSQLDPSGSKFRSPVGRPAGKAVPRPSKPGR